MYVCIYIYTVYAYVCVCVYQSIYTKRRSHFHLFAIFDFCSEYKKEKVKLVNLLPVQKVIECYFFLFIKKSGFIFTKDA